MLGSSPFSLLLFHVSGQFITESHKLYYIILYIYIYIYIYNMYYYQFNIISVIFILYILVKTNIFIIVHNNRTFTNYII